jgi:hypothetical protein
MLSHERLAARPQEASEHERDDDDVIELAGTRDEIRNQVERHRQVADESKQEQLPTKRHPVVANEPSDENDAVGNESGESACIAPAAGKQEHQTNSSHAMNATPKLIRLQAHQGTSWQCPPSTAGRSPPRGSPEGRRAILRGPAPVD